MKRIPTNYDSPYDDFDSNDLELNQYFRSEDIYNTKFMETNEISYIPQNFYHTGTDLFLASNMTFIDMDEIYEDFREYD